MVYSHHDWPDLGVSVSVRSKTTSIPFLIDQRHPRFISYWSFELTFFLLFTSHYPQFWLTTCWKWCSGISLSSQHLKTAMQRRFSPLGCPARWSAVLSAHVPSRSSFLLRRQIREFYFSSSKHRYNCTSSVTLRYQSGRKLAGYHRNNKNINKRYVQSFSALRISMLGVSRVLGCATWDRICLRFWLQNWEQM